MADYFETGYIVIGRDKFLPVQEISINSSRDLNPYYTSDSKVPLSIRSGRKKYEFTFKRAFQDSIMAAIFENDCEFTMILFDNDCADAASSTSNTTATLANKQKLVTLQGCRLSQDNIGPINGQDVVMEDIQGQAISRTIESFSSLIDCEKCDSDYVNGNNVTQNTNSATVKNVATNYAI